MQPEPPDGGGPNKLVIFGTVVIVVGAYILWKRRGSSSSNSATSGASMGSTPYGPMGGFGSVVPVIIQTPQSATVPEPVPAGNGGSGTTASVPVPPGPVQNTAPFFTNSGVNVPQWAKIPNPTLGSALARSGVPWQTQGNAQYYDPASLEKIAHPDLGQQLLNQGYNIFAINGSEYYYPGQKITSGTKGTFTQ